MSRFDTLVTLRYQNKVLGVVGASSSLEALYLHLLLVRLAEADREAASVRYQKENTLLIDHQFSLPDYLYKLIDIPILIEATYLQS